MIKVWEIAVGGSQPKLIEINSATPKPAESAVAPQPKLRARVMEGLYRVRRRIATGLAVILAVFFAYHVMFGRNGVNSYQMKRAEDRDLRRELDALQQENERLKSHVERLKSDPDAIEHEARERLHYARPGEVIYTLNAPQGSTEAPSANSASK